MVLVFLCDAACTPQGDRMTAMHNVNTTLLSVLKRGFSWEKEVSVTELELKVSD